MTEKFKFIEPNPETTCYDVLYVRPPVAEATIVSSVQQDKVSRFNSVGGVLEKYGLELTLLTLPRRRSGRLAHTFVTSAYFLGFILE